MKRTLAMSLVAVTAAGSGLLLAAPSQADPTCHARTGMHVSELLKLTDSASGNDISQCAQYQGVSQQNLAWFKVDFSAGNVTVKKHAPHTKVVSGSYVEYMDARRDAVSKVLVTHVGQVFNLNITEASGQRMQLHKAVVKFDIGGNGANNGASSNVSSKY